MKRTFKYYFLTVSLFCASGMAAAQSANSSDSSKSMYQSDFTIAYSLSIKAEERNGIAESYNGAIKTLFITDRQVRSRLVSLMRTQSVFYVSDTIKKDLITMIQESGKDKSRVNLTAGEWKEYNRKYDSATVELTEDSTVIQEYKCKRAYVKLKDGKILTVFYTPELRHPMFGLVEPAFKDIPGLVLQYEYANKQAVFTYTVTGISRNKIDPKVFKLP